MPIPMEDTDHCEEIQAMMKTIPGWITRWGIILLVMVFCSILIMSTYIRYPQTVRANANIVSLDRPVSVSLKNSNGASYVLKSNAQQVRQGDTLFYRTTKAGIIENIYTSPLLGKVYYVLGTDKLEDKGSLLLIPQQRSYAVQLSIVKDMVASIKPGQMVLLSFKSYPSLEFGILEGRIRDVIPANIDGFYLANVDLTNGTRTNKGKEISITAYLNGDAEIEISNESIFSRIFASLLNH